MNNQLSWSIMKRFAEKKSFGFGFQDVIREFPENNPSHLSRVLTNMVRKGMLSKVSWNYYHIIPRHEDPESYVPDGFQIAKYIMLDKDYYIGYESALKLHELVLPESKPSNPVQYGPSEDRVYVVSNQQMKPAIRHFNGLTVQFIKHYGTRFFGYESRWINPLEKGMVSDLEKTIVDVCTKPQYCGGIESVGNALFQVKDKVDSEILFLYFERNGNKSAKKRFLFLSDLLDLEWKTDPDKLRIGLGSGLTLLDPESANQGKIVSKLGLRINVDPAYLVEKIVGLKNPSTDVLQKGSL